MEGMTAGSGQKSGMSVTNTETTQSPWGRQLSEEMRECVRNCRDCHAICTETAIYCLHMGGKHAELSHLRLLLDCAQSCATSADFMLRQSDFHARICGVCAEVCERCAESCEQFGDDEQMKACAQMCRRCADTCRRMASMM